MTGLSPAHEARLEAFCQLVTAYYCNETSRAPLVEAYADLLGELVAAQATKDVAYSQRDRLVALLSTCFPASLGRHVGEWEDDWRNIVYINLPTGQASWHIHDSELPWFAHLKYGDEKWDGHSDDLKHARMEQQLVQARHAD